MKLTKKLSAVVVASVIAVPSMMVSAPALAGASADITVSNMYLWRGQNLSTPGPAISGGLSYSADSGLYAGAWTSSEGAAGSYETDLYFGYGGEVSGLGYDVSYWEYLYPETGDATTNMSDTDASEVVLSLSYAGFGFGAYIQADSDNDKNNYYTLSYGVDKFSVTFGMWDLENPGNEYSHLTFGYAATDELSFSVSILDNDVDESDPSALTDNPLFQVSYTKSFDL